MLTCHLGSHLAIHVLPTHSESPRTHFTWHISLLFSNTKIIWFFIYKLNHNTAITTKFCTCHDSSAVVACAKICSDRTANHWTTAKRYSHWLHPEVTYVTFLGKMAPGCVLNCLENHATRQGQNIKSWCNQGHNQMAKQTVWHYYCMGRWVIAWTRHFRRTSKFVFFLASEEVFSISIHFNVNVFSI